MPTIAESTTTLPFPARGTALASELAEALRLDLEDRGIRPTRLNVIGMALETGLAEEIALKLADLLDPPEEMARAA